MTVGERIKAQREKLGMTQKQLADKLNISYVNISQLESNKRNPKLETLERIADALDVRLDVMVGARQYWSVEGHDLMAERMSQLSQFLDSIKKLPSEDGEMFIDALYSFANGYSYLHDCKTLQEKYLQHMRSILDTVAAQARRVALFDDVVSNALDEVQIETVAQYVGFGGKFERNATRALLELSEAIEAEIYNCAVKFQAKDKEGDHHA